MDSVNSVSNHLDDLGNSSQEITAMTLLIEELKIKISEKYRAKF
jgi:dynein heavy chain